jgi:hypothetical protein
MKVTNDELNWCKASTRDTDLHPEFELCALVGFMKQELIKLANLNNEYESFLKEVKDGN